MDTQKMGDLIRTLRREKGLTQLQLADRLHVTDRTVSKWERGLGCPDVALLSRLAGELNVQLEALLRGERKVNAPDGGNMRKMKFYVCPCCGSILTSTGESTVICCGALLEPMEMKKAEADESLRVELIEDEYFISSDHEMTKEHYIAFVAMVKGDTLIFKRTYTEWNLEMRMPRLRAAMLVWYCVKDGLKYQLVR